MPKLKAVPPPDPSADEGAEYVAPPEEETPEWDDEQRQLVSAAGDPATDAVVEDPLTNKARAKRKTQTEVAEGLTDWLFPAEDQDEKLKILFYGKEGTTKTTSLAAAANLGVTLIINVEGGIKVKALQAQGVNTKNLLVWPEPGVPITIDALEELHAKLLARLQVNPGAIFAVGIDSVSELMSITTEAATTARVNKLVAAGRDINRDAVDRDDYGVATRQMRRVIRRLRDLPCHFILTALEREDDESGEIVPNLSPGIRADILGYVDQVLYFRGGAVGPGAKDKDAEDETVDLYRALTRPTGRIRAKDRLNVLPKVLARPTFERILGYVGGLTVETDPEQQAYEAAMSAQQVEKQAAGASRTAAKRTAKKVVTPTENKEQ